MRNKKREARSKKQEATPVGLNEKREMRNKKHNMGRRVLRILGACVGIMVAISVAQVVALKWVPIYRTPFMARQQVLAKQTHRPTAIRQEWVPIEAISDEMVRAVMASEDNLFQVHNGFSERGIRQAIAEKRKKGHVRHGGSTISQQTAKNVFTLGRRSYVRKAVEAYYTVLIEWIWGKERIMEVYLNVVETAEGVYGVEAISQEAYRHSAAGLSRQEAARIAACLPNPKKMKVTRPSTYVLNRQEQIAQLMPKLGRIDLANPENSDIYRNRRKFLEE